MNSDLLSLLRIALAISCLYSLNVDSHEIIEIQNDWLKIRLDNGNLGWLKKSNTGEI